MFTFVYSGRTRSGRVVGGKRRAETKSAAVAALRRAGIVVTRIEHVPERSVPVRWRSRRIPPASLAVFTRQLSVLTGAGVPLLRALDILARQEPHEQFSAAIARVRAEVESGAELAAAMRTHPHAFDAFYTSLIAAGEAAGVLDVVLKRLAGQIEKNVKLVRNVRSALIYPVTVVLVAAAVVAGVLWKVVPTFVDLFQGMGAPLPLPTRAVIASSHLLVQHGVLLVTIATAGALAVGRYIATPAGRLRADALLLKVPVLGGIVRNVAVARFCRSLATLLGSGIPILQALDISARSAGNMVVGQAIGATRAAIERGETLAAPLARSRVFPPMVVQMIEVGETSGALDAMLARVAEYYEDEVDGAVAGMLSLLEPALVVVLGLVVGGIVFSMYLPVFGLINRVA